MAKFEQKLKARKLRKGGRSIKVIAKLLNVSPSIVSIWCRDIVLTFQQIQRLQIQQKQAGYIGRLKGAKIQKERRLRLIKTFRESGRNDIGRLNSRDLFLIGLGLYAGEGFKYGNRAGFSNSDPRIIGLIMRWFREVCQVSDDRFSCQVGINVIHRDRAKKVQLFWSKMTGVPVKQFQKISFKKTNSKKVYSNREAHYGTLAIRIRKSAELEYKILGWLSALFK